VASISFIGLGAMGSAMVLRLLERGHDVSVYNRSHEPVARMVEAGAKALTEIGQAFENEIVISMLASDDAVSAVFSEATLSQVTAGRIHVNMASISVEAADLQAARHAEAGVGYVSAPVMGRPPVALAGQLNIITAGSNETLEQVAEILGDLGKKTWYVGPAPRTANLVKIGVNFNLIHALEALGESIALVESGGVDANLFVELLTDTAFTGSVYGGYGPMIANKRYFPASFNVALGKKDLMLVESAATEAGLTLPTLETLKSVFDQALADPAIANGDWSAIAEISRKK